MQIGERIKKIRTFRHLTQSELGTMLGFTDSFANNVLANMNPVIVFLKERQFLHLQML